MFNANNVCFVGDINKKLFHFLDYVADICIFEGDETLCNASNQGIVFKSGHNEFINCIYPLSMYLLSYSPCTHLFIHLSVLYPPDECTTIYTCALFEQPCCVKF